MKLLKTKVDYTDYHGTSNEQCSKCTHYIRINDKVANCAIIKGNIVPGGWCNKFNRKKKLKEMVL